MKDIKWLIETQILTRLKCVNIAIKKQGMNDYLDGVQETLEIMLEKSQEVDNEVDNINKAKHMIAQQANWYRIRFERYREVLKIIAATSIDTTSIDLAERALYKEFNVIDDEPCDYCKSIEKATPASPRHKYKHCPMCGKRRIKDAPNMP